MVAVALPVYLPKPVLTIAVKEFMRTIVSNWQDTTLHIV